MAFAGKWEVETQEGYDEFCRLLGFSEDIIEKGRDFKMTTEITQDGDAFSWTHNYPNDTKVNNKFIIGQEAYVETIDGHRFRTTVNLEGGKLVLSFPNYLQVCEVSGGKLIETSLAGTTMLKVVSKKI